MPPATLTLVPFTRCRACTSTPSEVEGVFGGDEQVAPLDAVGQRAGADADGREVGVGGCEGARVAADADPLDRLRLAGERHDAIADRQFFYRARADVGGDAGA